MAHLAMPLYPLRRWLHAIPRSPSGLNLAKSSINNCRSSRSATTTPSGAILPEPERTPFGLMGLVCAVIPGLLIGAAISKNIANFLEENELFVPSDDDDDDD